MKSLFATGVVAALLLASSATAQAQKMSPDRASVVRDHRGPYGVTGGGVKVKRCRKKTYSGACHPH
jgi:hypothetical protein